VLFSPEICVRYRYKEEVLDPRKKDAQAEKLGRNV
jgi:hypothetical protein